MEILQAFILGIMQGITEFLPISSSGHLALFQNFIGEVNVGFDVVLHLATLLAIFVFFYKDIWFIIRDFFTWKTESENFLLAWVLVISSVPIAILGWFLRDWIYGLFSNLFAVALGFFVSGLFLFLVSFSNLDRKKEKVGIGRGFIIGCAQALALVPGISRSGATVSSGMLLGVKREKAIRFSFFLAIPAIIGAGLLNFTDLLVIEVWPFIFGFVGAFVAGLFAIFVFMRWLKIERFKYFAYYCWLLALVVLLVASF